MVKVKKHSRKLTPRVGATVYYELKYKDDKDKIKKLKINGWVIQKYTTTLKGKKTTFAIVKTIFGRDVIGNIKLFKSR